MYFIIIIILFNHSNKNLYFLNKFALHVILHVSRTSGKNFKWIIFGFGPYLKIGLLSRIHKTYKMTLKKWKFEKKKVEL